MAIDPSISLGVRPPVIPPSQILNPVEQFGQILSLRNLMTQGQLGQLGLQQLQRQEDQRQAFAKYLQENLGRAAPVQTPPVQTPPLQTAPIVPPVAPTAPAGAPLGTLMSPQAPGVRPGAKSGPYITTLTPPEEAQFQAWVQTNHIPFDPSPTADYDMRGFWRSMMAGQSARSSTNLHFPDTFKTPYHQSFSNESMYATGDAPHWEGNRLVDKSGKVVFDESQGGQTPAAPQAGAAGAPLGTLPSPAAVVPSTPAAPLPAMVSQGTSLFGKLNLGEIVTKFPDIGPAFVKQAIETQKNQTEAEIKFHENNAKIAERLGSLGISIRDAKDPAARFAPAIWQALSEKLIPDQVGRQMIADGYEKHKDDIQSFIDSAQNGKDAADIQKTNLLTNQEALKTAAKIMPTINSQADYDAKFLPNVTPYVRSVLGSTWSPQLKEAVADLEVPRQDVPKTAMAQLQLDATKLAAARAQGQLQYDAALAKLSPERAAPFVGAATPREVMLRANDPEKYVTATKAAGTDITELEVNGKPHKVLIDKETGKIVKDLGVSGFKPQQVNVNASASLLDRESARFAKPHEKIVTDANAQLEKINEARSMINGPAAAQALGIPKVLTAVVGGQGSGLRINKAEMESITTARGIGGDLEGFIRKVSGEGKLTPEQQRQLTQVLDDVAGRIVQKQAAANDALDKINSAGSREEIVKIDSEARRKQGENVRSSAGGAAGAVNVTAPDGTVLTFPDQKSADAFKKKHGIQ